MNIKRECKECKSEFELRSDKDPKLFCCQKCVDGYLRARKHREKRNSKLAAKTNGRTGPIKRECLHCDVPLFIEEESNPQKFCNSSCAASHNNKGRIRTDESKQKLSEIMLAGFASGKFSNPVRLKSTKPKPIKTKRIAKPKKTVIPRYAKTLVYFKNCVICGKLFTTKLKASKTCCKKCSNQNHSNNMTEWLRNNPDHLKGPHVPSYMETSFKKWLDAEYPNVTVELEKHFWNAELGKNYYGDFVFPDLMLIIELDGNHHNEPHRQELDKSRDLYLSSLGYEVLRITVKEYRKQTRMAEVREKLSALSQ